MSQIFRLGWKDLIKGLVVVVLAAFFYGAIQLLPSLNLPPLVVTLLSAMFGYLAKNLATDEQGKLGGKI